jgi:hypothetical protein
MSSGDGGPGGGRGGPEPPVRGPDRGQRVRMRPPAGRPPHRGLCPAGGPSMATGSPPFPRVTRGLTRTWPLARSSHAEDGYDVRRTQMRAQ